MPTHPSHHDPGHGPSGTTRTRLPEGGGYATPRRPPARTSRTLVTVVGIVVLLIAALAFAGHGGGSSDDNGTAGGDAPSPAGPHATPTTPTGTRPVTTTTSGIPTGYPHTAEGAQSAAANYAVALGGDGMFHTTTRHTIVRTVYARGVVGARQKSFDDAYTDAAFLKRVGLNADGSAPRGLTFVSRPSPVGTKVDSFTPQSATVEVWYSSLFGLAGSGSTEPVAEDWYTDTFKLTWSQSDWKIDTLSQKDGPAPIGHDQAAASSQAITEAVHGFGGLTYAR